MIARQTKLFHGKAEIENWRQQTGPERLGSVTPERAREGRQLELPINPREVAVEAYFGKHSVARDRVLTADILKRACGRLSAKKRSGSSKATGSYSSTVRREDYEDTALRQIDLQPPEQRRTVDQVIVLPDGADAKGWYVRLSRARDSMHVYTRDKAALRQSVMYPGERMSVWELVQALRSSKPQSRNRMMPDLWATRQAEIGREIGMER